MTYYKIKHNNTYVPVKIKTTDDGIELINLINKNIISNSFPSYCSPMSFTEEIQKALHLNAKIENNFLIYESEEVQHSIIHSFINKKYFFFEFKSKKNEFLEDKDLKDIRKYNCFQSIEDLLKILIEKKMIESEDNFITEAFNR